MSFLITYEKVIVEDFRDLGGDIERTYLTESERIDKIDVALDRFKELHKMFPEQLIMRVL